MKNKIKLSIVGKFGTILADPPWEFQNSTGKIAPKHKRLKRYNTMKIEDIKALPITRLAAEKSHLYLWVPNAFIKEGIEVTVITGAPNFPDGKVFAGYKNKFFQTEIMNGIKVIRVWTYISPNRGLIKRILGISVLLPTTYLAFKKVVCGGSICASVRFIIESFLK